MSEELFGADGIFAHPTVKASRAMTEPTKSVDVAQSDRDAAREFLGDVVYRVSSSGQKLAEAFARHRLEATRTPPGESGLTGDWFVRNADRSNPTAFINTNPAYFAQECAASINRRAALSSPTDRT